MREERNEKRMTVWRNKPTDKPERRNRIVRMEEQRERNRKTSAEQK